MASLHSILSNLKTNSKPAKPKVERIVIPQYPIPGELTSILYRNLKEYGDMSETSLNYMDILKALQDAKCVDISERHYLQLLKLSLYLEAYQSSKNSKTKDQDEIVSEIVIIDGERFQLKKPEKVCDVKFANWPLRCAHYALGLLAQQGTITYLFPHQSKSFITTEISDCSDFGMIYENSDIATNAEQKQAIRNIVNKSSFPAPYVLYGPPGTGKTATLVEALCQIRRRSFTNILVCTPSNTAADEITKRLLRFSSPLSVYRMYSQSKDVSTIDPQIRSCSNVENDKIIYPKYEELIEKKIVITTLCNSIRLIIMKIPHDHFSHVFIDEAGQGTEPDMLIPISLVSNGGKLYSQIVFAGDPQQLGPTVISKLAESILGRSILERLMSYDAYKKDSNNKYNPKYITKLLENYRSHPDIIHISNELFYEKELIAKYPRSNKKEKFPIVFYGIEGKEEKDPHSHSTANCEEIRLVLAFVDALLSKNDNLAFGELTAKDVGIVTPFSYQKKMMEAILEKRKLTDINVGTVELFQGQERPVMIMTTVRSEKLVHQGKEHIGFLSSPKRFNVAITRAKRLLVVIGNPNVLQIDDNWRYLLRYCVDNKSYKGMEFSLGISSDDKGGDSPKLENSSDLFGDLSLSLPFYEEKRTLTNLMNNCYISD